MIKGFASTLGIMMINKEVVIISKFSNTVEYKLKTTLDASGLNKLQAEISKTQSALRLLQSQSHLDMNDANATIKHLADFQKVLNNSFNSRVGMLDMRKLQEQMQQSDLSLVGLQKDFQKAGLVGEMSFNQVLGRLNKLDIGVKSTSKSVDKIFNTIGNTVRWGVISSAFNQMTNSIYKSVEYVKDLDDSLTQIMLVTDYSRENMHDFAKQANEAAKSLGTTTTAMTNASLVFAQQGFNLEDSSKLAELSTKLANASQQSTQETSDQITAYMNAYGLDKDIDALHAAMDSWAEVANVSAADVGELARASQKAASTASTVGVSMDQLNGQIAAIESVTREAPEQIGNGLKTLYARLSDIKMGNTLEDGVNLGKVTQTLDAIGVQVLDGGGSMRNVGDIMEDLMSVWQALDKTEKAAVAQTLAGTHQLSRFEALMNRSDLYDQYKGASENASGTLDEMNEEMVDSLQGRLNKLQATFESTINDAISTDDIYQMLDAATTLLDTFNKLIESIGGGSAALKSFGSIATMVFQKQIGRAINQTLYNAKDMMVVKQNNTNETYHALTEMGLKNVRDDSNKNIVDTATSFRQHANIMSEEQKRTANEALERTVQLTNQVLEGESAINEKVESTNWLYQELLSSHEAVIKAERAADGTLQAQPQEELIVQMDAGTMMTADEAKRYGSTDVHAALDASSMRITDIRSAIQRYQKVRPVGTIEEEAVAFERVSSHVERTKKELDNLFTLLTGFDDIDFIDDINEDLRDAGLLTKQVVESMQGFEDAFDLSNEEEDFSIFVEKLETLQNKINIAAKAADQMPFTTPEEINAGNERQTDVQAAKNSQDNANNDLMKFLDDQDRITKMVQFSQGISELAFAWQSFQSLGSLFVNSELKDGEKAQMIVSNLLFTMPQLVMTGVQLTNTFKSLAGTGVLTAVLGHLQNTMVSLGVSEGVATVATDTLGVSLRSLIPGVGPLIAILTVLGSALGIGLGANSQKAAEHLQEVEKNATEAKDALDSLATSSSDFHDLYEGYKQGTVSAEELKNAATNLNSILQDQSLAVAAATGDWEHYNEALDAATSAKIRRANIDLEIERNEHASAANDAFKRDDHTSVDYTSGLNVITRSDDLVNFFNQTGADFDKVHINSDGSLALDSDTNMEEAIKQYQALIDAIDNHMGDYQNLTDQEKEVLEKARNDAQEALRNSDVQIVNEDDKLLGQNYAKTHQNDEDFQYKSGTDLEDYKAQIKAALEQEGLINNDTVIQAIVEAMAQNSNDLANQIKTKNIEPNFAEHLEASEIGSAEVLSPMLTGLFGSDADISGLIANNPGAAKQLISGIMSAAIDSAENLSDEEKLQLKDLVSTTPGDFSELIGVILTGVNQGLDAAKEQAGTLSNTIRLNETDSSGQHIRIRSTEAPELHDSDAAMEKYNVSDESINNYVENIKSTEEYRKAAQELNEVIEQGGDAAEDAQKRLDLLNAQVEDSAKDAIKSEKAFKKLADSWDNWSDILQNSDKNSSEYLDTLAEVEDTVGDMLNIDLSGADWGEAFINDNLDLIAAAAEGDIDALDALQAKAAEQVTIDVSQTGNLSSESLDILNSKIEEISGKNLEVGADLNDQAFTDALNTMLQNGEMTADQVNAFLNTMGYEPNIEDVPVTTDEFIVPPISLPDSLVTLIKDLNLPIPTSFGGIRVPGASTTVPQITPKNGAGTGITSKGGGVRSSHSGGRKGGGGGGRKGGGGGGRKGGGGGGKSYSPKENKKIDKVIDRYEKVNTVLESIASDYSKIEKEQSRLMGDKLTQNLKEQNKLLLRQIEIYKEKLKIQQDEAQEVKNKLSSQFGVAFDADGFMSNYAKVHQQLIDEVQRLGNQYSGLGSEEAEQALDKQYEAAEERLSKFEELYQRYDELISSDMKDSLQQIEDLKDAIEDMHIEIFKTAISALDNIKEIKKALAEFNQSTDIWFYDDPFAKAKENVIDLGNYWDNAIDNVDAYYDELIAKEREAQKQATTSEGKLFYSNRILQLQQAKANQGKDSLEYGGTGFFDMQLTNVLDIMKEMEEFEKTGFSSVFGENSAAMYETALDILKQANSNLSEYKQGVKDLESNINEMIDTILEKEQERQNLYENINEELEHQISLITMIHGEQAYDQLKQAYAAQLVNTKNQIAEMNQTLAANKELLSQMAAAGDTSSDAYKALKDNIVETQQSLNGLVQSSIENIRKQQELTVNSITNAWVKDALGTDLDWMQTEWELINRNADYYLDDVNKAYNIQKLQGKYLELLDQSNDLSIQNQITEQMKEQLGYLRDKKNLSEYDVQYANAQLEILQKRIALEEAQRNKSQMKLRRDSQGNYSYVYTANEGDVANAQDGLLDAQNNAYNLSKHQMQQTQTDSLSALADAKSLIDSIWTNANLSLEEKKKRTETIIGSLKEYLTATSEQLGVSEKNIINDFIGMCEALTDENKSNLEDTYAEIIKGNTDAFDKIDNRWNTSLTKWLESLESFNQETEQKFDSLYGEMEEYESQIGEIGDLVGQNFDDMTDSIQGTLDKTNELREGTQGFIHDLQQMSGAVADAEKSMAYYRDKITEANNEMSMYQQKVNELGKKLEQAERDKANMRAEIDKMNSQNGINGSGGNGNAIGNGGVNGQGNSAMAWGIAQSIWTFGQRSGWGNDPLRSGKLRKAYGDAFAKEVQNIINKNARSGKLVNQDSMKYSSYNLIGYDTGGYTGSWSDKENGRIALLHQKELVLNATDTQNILETVDAVRQLVATLKHQNMSGIVGQLMNHGFTFNPSAKDVNQNVHITAEFPNVSSSNEIEDALLSLNERAVQYAFKN